MTAQARTGRNLARRRLGWRSNKELHANEDSGRRASAHEDPKLLLLVVKMATFVVLAAAAAEAVMVVVMAAAAAAVAVLTGGITTLFDPCASRFMTNLWSFYTRGVQSLGKKSLPSGTLKRFHLEVVP